MHRKPESISANRRMRDMLTFRRDKMKSEVTASHRHSLGKEKKARTRARDDQRIAYEDSIDLGNAAPEYLFADFEPQAEGQAIEGGSGHHEPLIWEFDSPPVDGPAEFDRGIDPGEVYTLYDAEDPEFSLPEGGYRIFPDPSFRV